MAKSLQDFFQVSMFCSGTPSNFQRKAAEHYPEYSIHCSLKESIENGYVLKPYINLILTSHKDNFVAAIKAVFEKEMLLADSLNTHKIAPRILVNAAGIDEITSLLKTDYFNHNMGKLFHVIAMHTKKLVTINGKEELLEPSVDGVIQDKKELMERIQNCLDSNTMFNDNLPVLLFQVDTISEGINLKSFSATIITTDNSQKAMQQIGRVIRQHTYSNGMPKRIANVYFLEENYEKLAKLMYDLETYDLLDGCFDWGGSVDINIGCTPEKSKNPGELFNLTWAALDNNSPEIIKLQSLRTHVDLKEARKEIKLHEANINEVELKYEELRFNGKLSFEQKKYFAVKYKNPELYKCDMKICADFLRELNAII